MSRVHQNLKRKESVPYLIKGGRVVDPSCNRDETADLFMKDGVIADVPDTLPPDTVTIDAAGLVVAPGFIDIHVHLREPGGEDAETIESGSLAAARGGFTTIVAMPNTSPPISTPDRVDEITKIGDECGIVTVRTTGTITLDRASKALADLEGMANAWAIGFTDDGYTVMDDDLMRDAMERARDIGLPIMDHAQDTVMERKGVMHKGKFSEEFKLPGIPTVAESKIIFRDVLLAGETGCSVHIQHITSRDGVELLRDAQKRGVLVTGEATPHHIALADQDIDPNDANFKMNPPLRSEADREAIVKGIADGTLKALATDHAPHTRDAKSGGFMNAPFGIVGLETAIGVTYTTLVREGHIDLKTWIQRWTLGPAEIVNLPPPSLQKGAPADVVVMDLSSEWVVDPSQFLSKSRNTPFAGLPLTGRAKYTFHQGMMTWQEV